MQEQLHYFKLLQHKGVETDLRSQKNIKLGTIDYWITLKCEFSINARMEWKQQKINNKLNNSM